VKSPAGEVLTELFGKEPFITRSGGTIPATGIFKDVLGIDTISSRGACQAAGRRANEWYRLADYERGRVCYATLLERLKR